MDPNTQIALPALGFDRARVARICPLDGSMNHLSALETSILDTMGSPKRRESFVAGRIAAKRCVQDLVDPDNSRSLALLDIEIGRDKDGRPVVAILKKAEDALHVSISHGGDYAIAAAVRNGRIGVDVEPITDKAYRLREKIASPDELRIMAAAYLGEADMIADFTRLFSAKEAMVKHMGTNLFHGLFHYRLIDIAADEVVLEDALNESVQRVLTTVRDRHVFALLENGDERTIDISRTEQERRQ